MSTIGGRLTEEQRLDYYTSKYRALIEAGVDILEIPEFYDRKKIILKDESIVLLLNNIKDFASPDVYKFFYSKLIEESD